MFATTALFAEFPPPPPHTDRTLDLRLCKSVGWFVHVGGGKIKKLKVEYKQCRDTQR